MPNRIIKESICESAGLSECSFFANDLYKRLITYADDNGRFNADTMIMLARLYPRELDCVTEKDVCDALIELCGVNKIAFYTSEPKKQVYGCFPNWAEHQRVRENKKKCPDPDDTTVNDWYLQRFIPIDLKIEIIERDGFKCCECNKFITSDRDAKRLIKHGGGMYHIDHIVPVLQGGRATRENLRLLCPTCNLKRKKRFDFAEILAFAANGGELRRVAASCGLNPIQSNPNTNPNPNMNITRHKYGEYDNVLLSDDDMNKLKAEFPNDYESRIERLSSYKASTGKVYKNDLATIRNWAKKDDKPTKEIEQPKPQAGDLERMRRLIDKL